MTTKMYDVVTIGAGVAGRAFLSWLSRSKTVAAVVDGNLLEPGEKQSFKPDDVYMAKKQKAIALANVDAIAKNAVLLRYMRGIFIVYLEDGQMLCSKAIAIATGEKPAKQPWLGENAMIGNALIIGANDAGLSLAASLLKMGCPRTIICEEQLNAAGSMNKIKKLIKTGKAELLPNCKVSAISDNKDGSKSVRLSTDSTLKVDSIFYADKAIPQTDFISEQFAEKDSAGYVIAPNLSCERLPGLFFVGSCRKGSVSAYSDGKNAAKKAEAFIHGKPAV